MSNLTKKFLSVLISENQGLEKSRSILNPRKISGSANLDFFSGLETGFFSGLKPGKNQDFQEFFDAS